MSELVWSRFHPVTPAVKGWKVLVVVLAIAVQQGAENVTAARDAVDAVGWWPVVGAIAGVVLIGFLYSLVAWRMARFAVGPDAVHLQQGVLFRQQRTARLDRIQAIDVVQPLLARLLGLAELKIEVAGGSDSAVKLSFLREADAQVLRNELLARAAGVEFGTPEVPHAPVAPEREVLAVEASRILVSTLLSSAAIIGLIGIVGVAVAIAVTGEPSIAITLLPFLLGTAGYAVQRFNSEFGFRAAVSPDGIRLRHGFTSARAQTVPPGRVQAVRITQPLLWRSRGWWRVQVNVAGYGVSDAQTESVLLPVGDRDEALLALWLVLPDLGAEDPVALLDDALTGTGPGRFVTSPQSARWLDPLSWRRNGYALTGRGLVLRSGRFVRQVDVVPHERTQSLGLTQGPIQRRLGLASVALHSTPGPVSPTVPHLAADVAAHLLATQAERAREARASAGPERWMEHMHAR
ncbi:PH domain-containing protein, partial [Cellulomonas carbonis]